MGVKLATEHKPFRVTRFNSGTYAVSRDPNDPRLEICYVPSKAFAERIRDALNQRICDSLNAACDDWLDGIARDLGVVP